VPAARVNRAPITPHLLVIEQLNRNDLALATMHGGEVYRVGTDAQFWESYVGPEPDTDLRTSDNLQINANGSG